jgi:hypothetical protein
MASANVVMLKQGELPIGFAECEISGEVFYLAR